MSINAYGYVITNLSGRFELKRLHLCQLNCKLNVSLLAVTYVTVTKDVISDVTVATANLYHYNRAILQLLLLCSDAVSLKKNPISYALY